MKRRLILLALAAVVSTATYTASIDHIQTYTPEYLGNQAQNGMINHSSVYYNPAGLVHLEDGTYVHAGAELAIGHEKMKYDGRDYKAILLQPIPNFAAYKVYDNSALYWTFGGIGGGGDLKYKSGVAGTAVIPHLINHAFPLFDEITDTGSSAEGKNLYAQTTLGKVWTVDDKLSVSLGGRVVYGIRNLKGNIDVDTKFRPEIEGAIHGAVADNPALKPMIQEKVGGLKHIHADIDSERNAWGYGFQLGLNYKATEKLNLAMRYDSRVKLKFKAKGTMNNFQYDGFHMGQINVNPIDLGFGNFYPEYRPGHRQRRDLPAILALGASYKVNDNLTMALAGNYYFNKDAKMDRIAPDGQLGKDKLAGFVAEYDNGWEIALGAEYRMKKFPEWAVLGSINYAYTGAKVTSYDDVEYALNSFTIGTGLKYNPTDSDEWLFTICHFIYDGEKGHFDKKYKGTVPNAEYDKSITAFGISYTKRF